MKTDAKTAHDFPHISYPIEEQWLLTSWYSLSRGAPSTTRPPLRDREYRSFPNVSSVEANPTHRRNCGTHRQLTANSDTRQHKNNTRSSDDVPVITWRDILTEQWQRKFGRHSKPDFGPCPACGGSGYRVRARLPGEEGPFRVQFRTCWMCAGRLYFGPRWYDEGFSQEDQ